MNKIRYPSIPHLPFSESLQTDDTFISSLEYLKRADEIIVSDKLDGENTSMYRDDIHARSINAHSHPSRDWVRRFHGVFCHEIPDNMRIIGENVYAKHSIEYSNMPSYFFVFAIWIDDIVLAWNETLEWIDLFNQYLIECVPNDTSFRLYSVPILYSGSWNEEMVKQCYTGKSFESSAQEGFVVRDAGSFRVSEYPLRAAKFVRRNHIQPSAKHWLTQQVIPNHLTKK